MTHSFILSFPKFINIIEFSLETKKKIMIFFLFISIIKSHSFSPTNISTWYHYTPHTLLILFSLVLIDLRSV